MTTTTAQQLFDRCTELVQSYPSQTCVLPNGYPKAGRGFFPVASGSFRDNRIDAPLIPRKIMFVGQDWGAKDSLDALEKDQDEDMKSRTVSNLCGLLEEAEIQLQDCFFTNALFGVRTGKKSTGTSPGWKDQLFVDECSKALQFQIDILKPKAIICLGRHAPRLLRILFPECNIWHSSAGFKKIDSAGHSTLELDSQSSPMIAAILLHPSFRKLNRRYRCFPDSNGLDPEVAILRSVWMKVDLSET